MDKELQALEYVAKLAHEIEIFFGNRIHGEEGDKIRELMALIIELNEQIPFTYGLKQMNKEKKLYLKEKLTYFRNKEFKN